LIYMIAKSDTQRVGGIGAVYAQEKVIEMVSKVFLEAQKEYPELKDVGLMVFSGGGQAAPRGGGVISEVYNTVLKAVLRVQWSDEEIIALSKELAALGEHPDQQEVQRVLAESGIEQHLAENIIKSLPPIFTTQGHQNIILFGDHETAAITMGTFFSQAVYANAKLNRLIDEPEVLLPTGQINAEAQQARKNREIYFGAAMADYTTKVYDPDTSKPIDELLEDGPGKIMHLIVNGSRPSKRPDASKKSRAVDSRAIAYDQVLTLAGLNFGNYVGALAGLQKVIEENGGGEKGFAAAHSMYLHDKATRDSMRSMAVSLEMTNFYRAWLELIGKERPDIEKIKKLAAMNIESIDDSNLRKQITLAKLEIEAIEVAKLSYQVISGDQNKELENFTPKDLLKGFWPDLAAQMEEREKRLEPMSKILGQLIYNYNDTKDESKKRSLEKSIKLFSSNILALNEMPASVALTHTKHQKSQNTSRENSEEGSDVEVDLTQIEPSQKAPATVIRVIDTSVEKNMLSKICPFSCQGLTPRFAAGALQTVIAEQIAVI
jgi:hypothetical protein